MKGGVIMGFPHMLIVAIGLSLDVFAYCLYRGAMVAEIDKAEFAKMSAVFTAFQMGMLALGNLITWIPVVGKFYRSANLLWMVLASLMFFGLGIALILKAFIRRNKKIEESKSAALRMSVLLLWALMTSIDALIAGIGFGFLGFAFISSILVVGVITAITVTIGILCGYRLGCGPMNKFILLGGLLVFIGGVDVLANYLTRIY